MAKSTIVSAKWQHLKEKHTNRKDPETANAQPFVSPSKSTKKYTPPKVGQPKSAPKTKSLPQKRDPRLAKSGPKIQVGIPRKKEKVSPTPSPLANPYAAYPDFVEFSHAPVPSFKQSEEQPSKQRSTYSFAVGALVLISFATIVAMNWPLAFSGEAQQALDRLQEDVNVGIGSQVREIDQTQKDLQAVRSTQSKHRERASHLEGVYAASMEERTKSMNEVKNLLSVIERDSREASSELNQAIVRIEQQAVQEASRIQAFSVEQADFEKQLQLIQSRLKSRSRVN